jgi:hypothetical protein
MQTLLLVVIIGVSFLLGFGLNWIMSWRPQHIIERQYDAQQLLLAYFVDDDIARRRFLDWANTQDASDYAEFIYINYPGYVYLPPIGDPTKMHKHLVDMGARENGDQ